MSDKLQKILENNRKWPLIIVGVEMTDFPEGCTVILSDIPEKDLHKSGDYTPAWINEIGDDTYLLIKDLDAVSKEEQEKFITLIKDKRAGQYKLPENVQIIIPVQEKEKLSPKIQSLAVSWNMET